MGALTSLLVLASLLASIEENLPKTSYFKKIDVWFMSYIIFIFVIIVFHICVDFWSGAGANSGSAILVATEDHNNSTEKDLEVLQQRRNSASLHRVGATYLNNWGKVIFPIVLVVFTVLYFVLSLI